MLVSSTTSGINRKLGDKGAIKLLADVGFEAYDMSFGFCDNDFNFRFDEKYFEYIKELRVYADSLGIVCNQAHAPFHSSYGEAAKDDVRFEQIVGSIKCASILGAKAIVVHPKQHLEYPENIEILAQMNKEFYAKLLPVAEEYNIKIATENMWRYRNRIVDSVCAPAEEFCEYVDIQKNPYMTACLDIGHTPLVDRDLTEMIHKLGYRLTALHIHDNNLKDDSHTLPFLSKIDFAKVTSALKDVGYKGDITFEAECFFTNFPDELLLPAARLMCETGKYLRKQIIG